jgi:hypothetical protein
MKNILKVALVALTAFSFSVAQAGELSITGDAKASYAITSSDGVAGKVEQGKGLGVSNEFSLGASGELDNGWSWSYAQDIDGATVQDDGKLTVTMGSLGTAGIFISEGGLDTDNTASQSVVSRPSDTSFNEGMFDTFDLSGMNTIQYHMPADLLPFGIVGKVAYAPSSSSAANANASFKASGAANLGTFTESSDVGNTATNPFAQTSAMGKSATHYQLKAAPIDGLAIGADYVDYKGVESATSTQSLAQNPESGSYYATYAFGPATFGYSKSYVAFAIGSYAQDNTESVEASKYSVAFNVNDDLSVSYEKEESNPDNQTAATANYTLESTGIQAAYTMGGMTLAIAMNDHQNVNYTDTKDVKDTVFTVAMAF